MPVFRLLQPVPTALPRVVHGMGAAGSKTAGNAASAAAKTVSRRRLPDAPSAASVLASDASSRSQTQASVSTSPTTLKSTSRKQDTRTSSSRLDSEANFFRLVTVNDGHLSPVRSAIEDADIEKRIKEKDVTLVKRMDQLMGAVTMSKVEISGHARAREKAESIRILNANKPLIRIPAFAALFRRLKEMQRKGDAQSIDPNALAVEFGGDAQTINSVEKMYRHVDPTSVTIEQKPGAPPVMMQIKRWDGGVDVVGRGEGNTINPKIGR